MLTIVLAAAVAAEAPAGKPYPEPTMALVEACLADAVADNEVTETADSWKYICNGAPARALWDHLEALRIEPWEQVVSEGTWQTREFPLGGCFRRVKDPEGKPTDSGLSCSVWVPRKVG